MEADSRKRGRDEETKQETELDELKSVSKKRKLTIDTENLNEKKEVEEKEVVNNDSLANLLERMGVLSKQLSATFENLITSEVVEKMIRRMLTASYEVKMRFWEEMENIRLNLYSTMSQSHYEQQQKQYQQYQEQIQQHQMLQEEYKKQQNNGKDEINNEVKTPPKRTRRKLLLEGEVLDADEGRKSADDKSKSEVAANTPVAAAADTADTNAELKASKPEGSATKIDTPSSHTTSTTVASSHVGDTTATPTTPASQSTRSPPSPADGDMSYAHFHMSLSPFVKKQPAKEEEKERTVATPTTFYSYYSTVATREKSLVQEAYDSFPPLSQEHMLNRELMLAALFERQERAVLLIFRDVLDEIATTIYKRGSNLISGIQEVETM